MRAAVMSNRCLSGVVVALTVLVPGTTAWAQVEVEPDQRYLLLATERTSTMQEEIEEVQEGIEEVLELLAAQELFALLLEDLIEVGDDHRGGLHDGVACELCAGLVAVPDPEGREAEGRVDGVDAVDLLAHVVIARPIEIRDHDLLGISVGIVAAHAHQFCGPQAKQLVAPGVGLEF